MWTRIDIDDVRVRAIGIPVFGVSIPFLFHLYGPLGATDPIAWAGAAAFVALSAAIWQGNRWLLLRTRSARDWLERPLRRIGVLVAGIVLYTVPLTVAVLSAWQYVVGFDVDIRAVTLMNVICVIFIAHGYETVLLIKDRESDALIVERAERARAEAEILALRRQIDPHFIFNCLNALQHLVKHDADTAAVFVRDFAAVTRYLLSTSDKKTVTLAEELAFTRSYAALLSVRFGEGFRVDIKDEGADPASTLPPGGLQLLVENAAKHNAFHARAPLVVDVAIRAAEVVVTNARVRREDASNGGGVGLRNLAERVRLARATGGRELVVDAAPDVFRVTLPLAPAQHVPLVATEQRRA